MNIEFDRVKTIFLEAVESHSPEKWSCYLDDVCGEEQELRRQVEALLDIHANGDSLLEKGVLADGFPPGESLDESRSRIGPYTLLQQIGEGGMGVVYMAEQTEPVRRRVALKVIKPGMDSNQIIARFEAERQALSMMDHVNIARVLDAGATENGRPYFVMELVHGVPITKYCDDNHLTPRERLELFVPVCQAIQHAHQKGIIHRDIKPSNVMVTLYDGQPVPKVIDFGVAKATEQKLTQRTLFTQYGTMVGTLEYMSPEQAAMSVLGVDTRSDIYSLGVLLYELLTGSTPLSRERMREATFAEILRLIKDEEPPKPSMRLSASGAALTSISAQRQMEPTQLKKLMRGELDWIIMKTLEKDRNRRYETANGFAADVLRFLNGEAVLACPPNSSYLLRKFLMRNRSRLAATGLLSLAFLGVFITVLWAGFDRHARENQIAQEQLERAATLAAQVREILAEIERLITEDKWTDALVAARRAEAVMRTASSPLKEAEQIQTVVAQIDYIRRLDNVRLIPHAPIGMYDIAAMDRAYRVVFQDMGVDLRNATVQEASQRLRAYPAIASAIAFALDDWARHNRTKSLPDVDKLTELSQTIDNDPIRHQIRQAILKREYVKLQTLANASNLAKYPARTLWLLAISQSDVDLRLKTLKTAQSQSPGDFWSNLTLGKALVTNGPQQLQEALPYLYSALALRPTSTNLRVTIGHVLARLGRLDEAEVILQNEIEVHADFAQSYWALGFVSRRRGHDEEAIVLNRKAIELDPQLAVAYCDLGASLRELERFDEAVAVIRQAIEMQPNLIWAWLELGITRASEGKSEEAIDCFRDLIRIDPNFVDGYRWLGSVLLDENRFDEAADCFRKGLKAKPKHEDFYYRLGSLLLQQQKLEEAIACYRTALEIKPTNPVTFRSNLSVCLNNLSWQLATHSNLEMRDPERAVVLAEEAVELVRSNWSYWNTLGVAQYRAGDYEAAIVSLKKSRELNSSNTAIDFFFLTMAQWQLDDKIAARQEFDKAVQRMVDNQSIDEETNRFHDEAAELLGIKQSMLLHQD